MKDQTKALDKAWDLAVDRLRSGSIVRPAGQLGSVGWYPKAWSAAYVTRKGAVNSFLANNPNWYFEDIKGVKHER